MKNNSRVKNIYVTNLEAFEDALVLSLIKNQISYVQMENEFHFFDKIYRIHDCRELLKGEEGKETSEETVDESAKIEDIDATENFALVRVFDSTSLLLCRSQEELKSTLIDSSVVSTAFEPKINKALPTYNKRMIKEQNKLMSQRLKNSTTNKF